MSDRLKLFVHAANESFRSGALDTTFSNAQGSHLAFTTAVSIAVCVLSGSRLILLRRRIVRRHGLLTASPTCHTLCTMQFLGPSSMIVAVC